MGCRGKSVEALEALADEAWDRARAQPAEPSVQALLSDFDPWWGQRLVLRSPASWRVLVAARQVGKSFLSVQLTLRVALERPGTKSVLLVPTLRHARQPTALLRAAAEPLPGVRWNATDRRLRFPNGSVWEVYSAEREGSTRGLTIDGLLWADEAALIPLRAWNEILPAAGHAQKLLTTTPAGKNWVFDEFLSRDPQHESFRFRSEDSPHVNHEEVARTRASMTPEFAAQEFDAEFVDGLILAFPDTRGLFVTQLPDRADPANVLGIDLGKEQDWTVVTLLNQFAEGQILGRWQHTDWPTTTGRILDLIRAHDVRVVCVDKAQVGSYVADELRRLQRRGDLPLREVIAFETFSVSKKADLVERTRADVQHLRLKLLENDHSDQLRYELARFQGIKRVSQGREYTSYGCPAGRGEHDDCVISLCLANWARAHAEASLQPQRQHVSLTALKRINRLVQNLEGGPPLLGYV